MVRVLVAFALTMTFAPAASSAECYGVDVDFNPGAIVLATVTVDKTYFHDDALKRSKAFVVKGDELLVLPAGPGDEWACATYIGTKGVDT